MSLGEYTARPEDNNPDVFERLQRSRAIANGQKKLLDAEKKDTVLSSGNADGSYRFAPDTIIKIDNEIVRRVRITLVPNRREAGKVAIHQLDVWFVTLNWDDASPLLRDIHQINLRDNASEAYLESSTSEPRYVPTCDMFATAHHISGERIDFLVNDYRESVFCNYSDIKKAHPSAALEGQYYDIEPSLLSAEQEDQLNKWFQNDDLATIVKSYEPTVFREGTATDSVA